MPDKIRELRDQVFTAAERSVRWLRQNDPAALDAGRWCAGAGAEWFLFSAGWIRPPAIISSSQGVPVTEIGPRRPGI